MKNPRFYTFLSLIFAFLLTSNACDKKSSSDSTDTITSDSTLVESTSKIPLTYKGDFTDLWKKVDSLEQQGLYKSALEVVDFIFANAKASQNSPVALKAIIHSLKYNSYIEEENYVLAINELKQLSQSEKFPLKQLIHSVTADVYWRYYQQNRWKFMQRSTTVDFENNDIRTWDLTHLADEVTKHYQLSLSESENTQKIALLDFKDILLNVDDVLETEPTLFDFLAGRAFDHFKNTETSLTRPENRFFVEGKSYFGSAEEFLNISTNSDDSLSNQLHAVRILKQLTQFHLTDNAIPVKVNVEIRRLLFAKENCKNEEARTWYMDALNRLAEKYKNEPVFSEINYYKAVEYQTLGNQYSTSNPDARWELKKAVDLCNEGIEKFPSSHGALKCESLKSSITAKSMSFTTEMAYAPNKKNKLLVSFKNIDSMYFRIIKTSWNEFNHGRLYGKELINEMLKYSTVKEWAVKLENPKDFQQHSTEIVLPGMDLGHYHIISSPSKDFKDAQNAIAYGSFWATNIGYTQRANENGSYSIAVLNRETGAPLSKVKGTVYVQKYDYTSRKYEFKRMETYVSDAKGLFTIDKKEDSRSFYLSLAYGNDEFNNGGQYYQYDRRYNENESYTSTHFYTDRAIYRPGQTIYFKGIKLKHAGEKHTIVTNLTTTIEFMDVNYQKVGEVKVTTNEYGTFSGSFTAPSTGLNGQMSLQEVDGSHFVLVEEYKRPKFEVNLKPVQGSFKLGQKINVQGEAKSYAGAVIDGAKVSYRVTRSSYFSRWTYYRYGFYPTASSAIEITNGTVTTDEKGNFTIPFEAKSDPSIASKYAPNYSYTISVDVTDSNGETRSTTQTVNVGTSALSINLAIPEKIDKKRNHAYPIATTNLSGQKIATSGRVVVTKLSEPKRLLRQNLWQKPDIQSINQEEYTTLFPNDSWDEATEISTLKKEQKVISKNFSTANSDSILLKELNTLEVGRYMVETIALDTFGVEVTEINYFTMTDQSNAKNPTNELWSITPLLTYCEPGQNATFLISSAANNFSVLYEIEKKGKIVHSEIIVLNASQKLISLPILETDRGNVTVHFSGVKFGRVFKQTETVIVPFSNKELELTFETFRDKLLPGAEEEWRLRIKGPGGEKVAAELLVAMYDASLDQFAGNSFYLNPYESYYSYSHRDGNSFGIRNAQLYDNAWNKYIPMPYRQKVTLNWFGFESYYGGYYYNLRGSRSDNILEFADSESIEEVTISAAKSSDKDFKNAAPPSPGMAREEAEISDEKKGEDFNQSTTRGPNQQGLAAIQARTNLNETAFFFPQLTTDANGDILLKFKMPEALTRWKLIGLAHTKDLKIGNIQKEVVTQKELMVQPNSPRFFREGDHITFSAKVSNLTKEDLTGEAQLLLFDALTSESIDAQFNNVNATIPFSVKAEQSTPLLWEIDIPEGIGAVTYRVVAKAKNHTDGEEMVVPILSNRMLVTESLPLPSKGIGTKNFFFTKLIESGNSSSIKHHKVTLEYTSNPAWYAIQAMPYMMEYPHECAEQTFTRYYANAIASNIVNSSPKIKSVFESWKQSSPDAFLSNLQKNQELKSVILEETPWVLDAQNESERKKRVALLFDLNHMDNELSQTIRKLEKMQVSNGGWTWFPGMPESRYITQHIITGMGHLDNLGVKNVREDKSVWKMVEKGVQYLDARIVDDFEWIKTHDPNYKSEQHLSETQIQFLYARSFFKDIPMSAKTKEAVDYFQAQAKTYWTKYSIYAEGMIALQAHRYEQPALAKSILKSLNERALVNDELGMYWKDNVGGYYWHQAPIETQALLIEAFDEISDDPTIVEELKVWLLKQKQTTDWKTTKATAEACYALLLRGTAILENTEQVEIKINNQLLDLTSKNTPVEAGTGYIKTSWSGDEITPELGKITVTRATEGVSWGAMYWQYFEDLDKITSHATGLKLNKQLFSVTNTTSGPVIRPITSSTPLKIGDKVRVRIELRTDRNLEYVHLKDMRAAGFEPINVISRYKWQDGLGYYESTRDAATHFFFDYIPKGTYVFEYDIRVSHAGQFSNGVATIQCMYAPEFTSHSEGIMVKVSGK